LSNSGQPRKEKGGARGRGTTVPDCHYRVFEEEIERQKRRAGDKVPSQKKSGIEG